MGKIWQLYGPDEDILTLAQTAKLFGYEIKSFRKLIKEGYYPRPRGLAPKEYYTGADIAAIWQLSPRYGPQDAPGVPKKDAHNDGEEES